MPVFDESHFVGADKPLEAFPPNMLQCNRLIATVVYEKSYSALQVTPPTAVLKMKLNIKGATTAAGWSGHSWPWYSNCFTNIAATTNVSFGYKTISHTYTQGYSKISAN